MTLTKVKLVQLIGTGSVDGLVTAGRPGVWTGILELTDEADVDFVVVTP